MGGYTGASIPDNEKSVAKKKKKNGTAFLGEDEEEQLPRKDNEKSIDSSLLQRKNSKGRKGRAKG